MTYASLSKIDFSPAQDLALVIEFKQLANDGRTTAASPEEELAIRVLAIMEDLEAKHAKPGQSPELKAKADAAIASGDAQQTAAYATFMLANYGVDVNPVVPAEKP